ncbi:MAG: hypothetical protein ACRDIA_04630 [Actinomycetota bacterium]
MKESFSVGEKVRVVWGLDFAEGVLEEIYGPPNHPMALVRVNTLGPRGESLGDETLSVSLAAVEPLSRPATR